MEQGVILETARLRLRQFTLDDAEAMEAIQGDPIVMQYYPSVLDRKGVEAWIERNIGRYQRDGYGLWAILRKDTGDLIGDCGCIVQEVEGKNEIEVGYQVRRDLWCNGYATEAARACMEYAFTRLGAARVISMIRPPNMASRRVAEKNGLVCEKVVFWHGFDHCIYARSKG
ncbi:MAG TPA: GNAT family N-acetyltransferase [Candidatus Angelobacter sp.]|nr:GNAT family N-acetyltransferase [Candidatus Angelobacter sp.]